MAEKKLLAHAIVVVCAAHTGYRRAGMALANGENILQPESITETQLAQLKADPKLAVSIQEQQAVPSSASKQSGALDADSLPNCLVEAIALLSPDNSEHFTSSGKPTTEALSELMQTKVSAAERDEAWEQYQAAHSDTQADSQGGE